MSATDEARKLRLRRDDCCATCRVELPAGTSAIWHPGPRHVTCLTCATPGPGRARSGTAGASARREYDRRHAAREDRAREKLGTLGVALARVVSEPQNTRAWKTGAEGEERVAKRLEQLLAHTPVTLLHDRRMPGHGAANIDHLAIGPGGITVIDAKNYRGKVTTERVGGLFSERRTLLKINGRDCTHLVNGIEKQVDVVKATLERHGLRSVNVRGALCFVNPDGLPLFGSQNVRGILVACTRATAKLARRRGAITEEEVTQLLVALAAALPPA